MNFYELSADDLRRKFVKSEISVKKSECLNSEIIGQDIAKEALLFGLNIKKKDYNIFVAGGKGSGKTTFAEKYAREVAKNEKAPDDLCYVCNFLNPKEPRLLRFPAGDGKKFKDELDELIHILSIEIPKAYNNAEYENEKDNLNKSFKNKKDEVFKSITEIAKENNFSVKASNGGIYFLPIIDGKTLSEEEYDALTEEEKEDISQKGNDIQDKVSDALKIMKELDKENKKELENLDFNIALIMLGHHLQNIQEKHSGNSAVIDYLAEVKEDILNNIVDFTAAEANDEEDDPLQMMLPWVNKKPSEDIFARYKVNLIVDNSEQKGAPVIVSYNPTYTNLIGEVEYDNEGGNFVTDFMKIKPGLLHKANGGYLILQIADVLNSPYSWDTLKRVIKTGTILVEPLKEYLLGGIAVSGLKPQDVGIDIKIILIGTNYYYDLLCEYDDDFSKLFKICAMFDYEMPCTSENIKSLAGLLKSYSFKNGGLNITDDASCVLLEYASRLAERKDKLTTKIGQLNDIIIEAQAWAKIDKASSVSRRHIQKAIDKKYERVSLYENKYSEMILNNEIMIDTEGKKVGQINGLAVLDNGNYCFGKPTRITATTYMGKSGIVNIEKEAEMSGSIHDKGIQVLTGYLGSKYAQQFPLSLSCRICFEQNYNGVDGDSASSTELYCVLSSLANLPIRQDIAVTGSINQMGEIQPIGGATAKIEGFFDLCQKRGLTGTQGVIIPVQNVSDLTLKEEVCKAVEKGIFHIYPISDVNEGIEILMGAKAGKQLKNGSFEKNTIHRKVFDKLEEYFKSSIEE